MGVGCQIKRGRETDDWQRRRREKEVGGRLTGYEKGSQNITKITGKFDFGILNEARQRLTEFCQVKQDLEPTMAQSWASYCKIQAQIEENR